MRSRFGIHFLFLILFSFSSVVSAAPFSLTFKKNYWAKKSIRVCFGSAAHYALTAMPDIFAEFEKDRTTLKDGTVMGEFTPEQRKKIQSIIQREYQIKRTGIEFTGWTLCSTSANEADAILMIGGKDFVQWGFDGYSDVAKDPTAAQDLSGTQKMKKPFVYMGQPGTFHKSDAPMNNDEFFEILMIHEFGHLAGLAHENPRISKKNKDINCARTVDGYEDFISTDESVAGEPEDATTEAFSAYDPNSVMSYCYWDVLSINTGLRFYTDSNLGADYYQQVDDTEAYAPDAISLLDPLLYKKKKISATRSLVEVHPGLSLGDIHTLRCLHDFYKPAVKAAKCNADFVATRDPELLKLVHAR